MTTYGYARVSTSGQDLAAQEAELMAAGCAKVFKEKVSGAKTNRAELTKAIRRLEAGDVLVVTRLDRLARSTRDLLNVLATVGEREAGFRSLKDTWADTTTPHGRLMLTVLGGLAEFERELIRARTGDGRARAMARGVKATPSPSPPPLTAGGGGMHRTPLAKTENSFSFKDLARNSFYLPSAPAFVGLFVGTAQRNANSVTISMVHGRDGGLAEANALQ